MKRNKRKKVKPKSCYHCPCCLPVGEGDHFCDELLELVFANYAPTEHFCGCMKNRKGAGDKYGEAYRDGTNSGTRG